MWWLVFVAVEVAVLCLRMWTRSIRHRYVALLRLTASGLFLVTAVTGLIDWGARYLLLAVWLTLTGLAAVWILVTSSPDYADSGIPARRGVILLHSFAALLGVCTAAVPVVLFPSYEPIEPSGSLAVRHLVTDVRIPGDVAFREHRDPRGRAVPVEIWYPNVDTGHFPLVVFSHGGFGTRSSNRSLYADLASHGYVVAAVDHPGHALFATDEHGRKSWIDLSYLGDLMTEDADKDPAKSSRLYREWMKIRVGDLDAVIDFVLGRAGEERPALPFRLIDARRIGAIGHSLGGAAAIELGRERDDVGAVIALEAPFMGDITGVADGEFVWDPAPYPRPLLNVYSDTAWGHLDEWPQYERNEELVEHPGPDVSNVHLDGVGHLGLTDLALASPLLTRILDGHPSSADARDALRELNLICRRFLDEHL